MNTDTSFVHDNIGTAVEAAQARANHTGSPFCVCELDNGYYIVSSVCGNYGMTVHYRALPDENKDSR